MTKQKPAPPRKPISYRSIRVTPECHRQARELAALRDTEISLAVAAVIAAAVDREREARYRGTGAANRD